MKLKREVIIIGLIIIGIIIITIISIVILKKPKSNEPEPNNPKSKYSEEATAIMKEKNIFDEINNLEYSKTLETIIEENDYVAKYLDEYLKIEYADITNFSETINTFLEKEYNSTEINHILKNYSSNLDILLNMEYIDILEFKDITNFKIDNLERYLNYQKANDYDLKTVVTYVNIGLDLKGYSKYKSYTMEEADDLSILVNKYNKLPDDYEPNDLVSLSYNSTYELRKVAADAFEELTSAALIDNVIVYPFSTYRSYKTQNVLYTRYKNRDGEAKADTYSARPGFSEHQLGLAVDIRSNTLSDNLTNNDYKWMLNNSYKYGFIVRYPKGKQHITQFIEEPWHLRYLGVDLATKVHNSGLTYDEYHDLYLSK